MNPDQVIDEASRKLQEQKTKDLQIPQQGTSTTWKPQDPTTFYHPSQTPKQDQTLQHQEDHTGSIWTKRSFNSTTPSKPPQQPTPLALDKVHHHKKLLLNRPQHKPLRSQLLFTNRHQCLLDKPPHRKASPQPARTTDPTPTTPTPTTPTPNNPLFRLSTKKMI